MTENITQSAECLSHLTAELDTTSDEQHLFNCHIAPVLIDIGREVAKENEDKLLKQLAKTYRELQKHGWQDAFYCPKDGSVFLAIEAGSTGIHECTYTGKWPEGTWWIHEEFDMYPSKPILWKPKPCLIGKQENGRCGCCEREGQYNGLGSGSLLFICHKSCPCHD